MEFSWDATEISYRQELKAFLAEHLPPGWNGYDRSDLESYKRESKAFAKAMAARGWLTQNWPIEYGGQDTSPWRSVVVSEELTAIGEPRGPQYMNVNWVGPAIMHAGTEAQKAYHLPKIAAGDVCWSQGFSEPDAGSDLASLRTRAVRDGNDYVVNGAKIWTSHVGSADFLFLLVRTDPDASKRAAGISILLTPMNTPGIEVRKIGNFVSEESFHQLTFTDMRVPIEFRLGAENAGWDIVRYALAYERVGAAHYSTAERILFKAIEEAKANGGIEDPEIQTQIGAVYAAIEAARLLCYKVVDQRVQKSPPTADANIARVAQVRSVQLAVDLEQCVLAEDGYGPNGRKDFRHGIVLGIAAGALDIQLGLIASKYLNLPRR